MDSSGVWKWNGMEKLGREKERAGKLIRISVLLGFSGGSRLEGISNRQGPRFAPRTATWIDPHAYF